MRFSQGFTAATSRAPLPGPYPKSWRLPVPTADFGSHVLVRMDERRRQPPAELSRSSWMKQEESHG